MRSTELRQQEVKGRNVRYTKVKSAILPQQSRSCAKNAPHCRLGRASTQLPPDRIEGLHNCFIFNKDYQRMMVGLMFMIVQSLRSFLPAVSPTAVTPTAVAPIGVILPEFT